MPTAERQVQHRVVTESRDAVAAAAAALPRLCHTLRLLRRLCCSDLDHPERPPVGRRLRGPEAALAHEQAAVICFAGPAAAAAAR